MIRNLAVAVLLLSPALAVAGPTLVERLAAGDVQRGDRIVSRQCAVACHTFEKGGGALVGPNLWGIVGKPMARREDYRYSQVMRERAAQGGIWTWEALDAYLAGPRDFLPGTSMTFVGLERPQDRADVILFLRSLSDTPQPLSDTG